MLKKIATTGALAGVLLAGAASAQDAMGDEERFYDLNLAFAAAMRCGDMTFSQDDHNTIQSAIAEMAGENIGAGQRLQLIHDAKERIHKLTLVQGCSQAHVAESLSLYEAELASLL